MYSRYVPPAKGLAKAPEAEVQNAVVEPAAQNQSQVRPGEYSRYIPPPKSTKTVSAQSKQHVQFDDEDEGSSHLRPSKKVKLAAEPSEQAIELQTGSNGTTHQDGISKEPVGSDEAVQTPLDESVHGVSAGKKEKKSKKKKKKLRTSVVEDDLSDDEEAIVPDATANAPEPMSLDEEEPEVSPPVKARRERVKEKKKKAQDESQDQEGEDEVQKRHKSVFEKKAKSLKRAPEEAAVTEMSQIQPTEDDTAMEDAPEPVELHGLQPLPQPEPITFDNFKVTYETLPPWLAEPIRVSPKTTAAFTDFGLSPELGISNEIAERLAAKGYKEAFAVQTAAIPLLLPHHSKTQQGDLLVSASTGSGKTLAYALPLIRDLSLGNRRSTKLRAVVVLPTRELVRQAQQVCEECAGIFSLDGKMRRVKIGIAMGSQTLQKEQTILVDREERYDPEAFQKRQKRLASHDQAAYEPEDDAYTTEDEEKAEIWRREDAVDTLPDYVIDYQSKVDILICTPGRLVEHVKYTPGFTLDFVRWLIVDEADKLLSQDFQQWQDVVIPKLQSNTIANARNHMQSNLSGVRKVILSATMTRDLDSLSGLKLRWPKLIVLEGSSPEGDERQPDEAQHALPSLLEEAALKVDNPDLKPLYLLDLLQIPEMIGTKQRDMDDDDDETSSSGSDSESDEGQDSPTPASARREPNILIFTKSNETALRLARLLSLLSPPLENLLAPLTSTTPYSTRKQTLRSFTTGKLRIIVASDLVARGIDLPTLDFVVNYDMPTSVESYVHRVGRTARAGRVGKAWTLFTNAEARWFWREIGGEKGKKDIGPVGSIRRTGKIERVRYTDQEAEGFEDRAQAYEQALGELGREAGQRRP